MHIILLCGVPRIYYFHTGCTINKYILPAYLLNKQGVLEISKYFLKQKWKYMPLQIFKASAAGCTNLDNKLYNRFTGPTLFIYVFFINA